ncbi:MAG: UDP-N-acetylmuramoyl-L-alanyl-D-glutamate--2,6-diaminopimelate ligase [Chloroflexi bacterium]|nr:UDP-N-acetylmuramoyl-L-alanyl-D-glutamate--2,6-diaminopimelate ligase [Chloroflexota bacterium]
MKLSQLLATLPWPIKTLPGDVEIKGIADHSQQVRPGYLFVAIKGEETDGHRFIPQAIKNGAAAVLVQKGAKRSHFPGLPILTVPDSRQALGYLAAAWHDFPSRKLRLIGVTGTDGKTTTVTMIRIILQRARHKTGAVTSVSASIGRQELDTGLHTTTPGSLDLQGYLAKMVEAGCGYAIIEATSHGLVQDRLVGCDFDVAAITNITHEHLDYHKTLHQYREAKALLFRQLEKSFRKPETLKVSVLNADDPSFEYLAEIPADLQLSYGIKEPADVMAGDVYTSGRTSQFTAFTPSGDFEIELPLPGEFNVYNALAAIAVAISQEVEPEIIQETLLRFPGVMGRMEKVDQGQPFTVVIDFAHTPNSLAQALRTARNMTTGRLTVVFGCAGERDKKKRPKMGEIACQFADRVVLTAEDPRRESLTRILQEIATGCKKTGKKEGRDWFRIPDRKQAIRFALEKAQPGDLVLITGKGHEKSMAFGTTEYPWSDHQAVRETLAEIKK